MYTFPMDFPTDLLVVNNENIFQAYGGGYRLVIHTPLDENDFLSTRLANPKRKYSNQCDEFKSYGISFWRNVDRVKQVKNNYPSESQLGRSKIVFVDFNMSLGVIQEEKNSHVTLWKQQDQYVSQCSYMEVK